MKLDEGQLYRAAALADAMELALLPDTESCPKHEFSDEFERNMQELIGKIKRTKFAHTKYSWAGSTMPNAVSPPS